MTRISLILIWLVLSFQAKGQDSLITIIDIGLLDRNGIAEELKIIDKLNPKVIGLDFLLTTDSLEKDDLLAKAIRDSRNLILVSTLHNYSETKKQWDSLEINLPKFANGKVGFSNLNATEDSIFIPKLPLTQYYKDIQINAFSFEVAKHSFGVNSFYTHDTEYLFNQYAIGQNFKIISVTDMLELNFDASDITNKIVLLGRISEDEDSYYLRHYGSDKISGVEIHASIIDQILK